MKLLRAIWFPSMFLLMFLTVMYIGAYYMETVTTTIGLAGSTIFYLDVTGRYLDFRYVSRLRAKDASLIAFSNRRSFCSRQVMIAVLGPSTARYYKSMGYRWYHIFPDGTFSGRSPFLNLTFWRKLFGLHTQA